MMVDWFKCFGLIQLVGRTMSIFCNVLSFDTTYSMNQYDLKFASFMGVNHHMSSIFFGAAFLVDEKIESYV
jgi:hypothetical protein